MDIAHEIRLDLPSRLEELELVDRLVEALLEHIGVEEAMRSHLTLAVREAAANAVFHGNRLDSGKRTTIVLLVERRDLRVQVIDEGSGFDPSTVPDPLAPENLLKPSGRGLLLMRNFMDEVEFEFPDSGGTVVSMRKVLAVPEGSQESETEDAAGGAGAVRS